MSNAPDRLAGGPSFWTRADVSDETRWIERLGPVELDELGRVADALRGRPLSELKPDLLPSSGRLAEAARRWRATLKVGLGFVLVRGVEVDGVTPEELALRYAILGLYLGTFVPQNMRGELLTHIRDTGADPTLSSTRLYTTRAEQEFHTDGADIIGLLCRRTSRSGGTSRIVSSGAIVAEIQRTRPDLYSVLFGDFPWHYQEAGMPTALWFARPICTVPGTTPEGALLNTFFIPWYIWRSQELPDAPRLTEQQSEVLTLIVELANDPRFFLDMAFEPGDVQWLKNAAILHKRTEYQDFDEPDRKRHLLRLWLSAPDFADGNALLRAGITTESAR
jgi:hypothetical protein